MPVCGIPLKRLMPSSLSQARTRYPPAGCADLVNEFISWVVAAALGPGALRLTAHVARPSGSQLQHRREERKARKTRRKEQRRQQQWIVVGKSPPSSRKFKGCHLVAGGRKSGNPSTQNGKEPLGSFLLWREAFLSRGRNVPLSMDSAITIQIISLRLAGEI